MGNVFSLSKNETSKTCNYLFQFQYNHDLELFQSRSNIHKLSNVNSSNDSFDFAIYEFKSKFAIMIPTATIGEG